MNLEPFDIVEWVMAILLIEVTILLTYVVIQIITGAV